MPRRSNRVAEAANSQPPAQLLTANARAANRVPIFSTTANSNAGTPPRLRVRSRAEDQAEQLEESCELLINQLGATTNRLHAHRVHVSEALDQVRERVDDFQQTVDELRLICVRLDMRLPALTNRGRRSEWEDFVEDCLFESARTTGELSEMGRSSSRKSNQAIASEAAELSLRAKKRQRR